ncbi:hypothetical protein [Paenibacillus sp. YYML68]|uniref:hypothetical protein n=1 Tax=Paenibacillus sp. YYML68 TaxID=2909250 RepID=UPI00249032CE|nr:hypothetical protein [Paenibacillus sp. YYML68]
MTKWTLQGLVAVIAVVATGFTGMLWPEVAGATRSMIGTMVPLEQVHLYDNPYPPHRSVGRVAPYQNVEPALKDGQTQDQVIVETKEGLWVKVRTWLGDKWVRDTDAIAYGSFTVVQQDVTLMGEARLYDEPRITTDTGQRLAPQQVRVTARLWTRPKSFSSVTSMMLRQAEWVRVETSWMGEKWLHNPPIYEDITPQPSDYSIKLQQQELAYLLPHAQSSEGLALAPGAYEASATYVTGFGPWSTTWYRVKLAQGDRWVAPQEGKVWTHYRVIQAPYELKTEARCSTGPLGIGEPCGQWLPKGTYQALEATGPWISLETPYGVKWIHEELARKERPEGIVPTDESIQLTADMATYAYPSTEQMAHTPGFYAPQQVQAFEKWDAGNGDVWYHFRSFSGSEWVRVPKQPS